MKHSIMTKVLAGSALAVLLMPAAASAHGFKLGLGLGVGATVAHEQNKDKNDGNRMMSGSANKLNKKPSTS
jgi:hypothetical protein